MAAKKKAKLKAVKAKRRKGGTVGEPGNWGWVKDQDKRKPPTRDQDKRTKEK